SLGQQRGFLDLVDRPLLVPVLDPAGAAAATGSDRVQTETDGDHGRSAQWAAWHLRTSLVVSLVAVVGLHGRAAGAEPASCFAPARINWGACPHRWPQASLPGLGGPGCAGRWPPPSWAPGSGVRRCRPWPRCPLPSRGRAG